MKVGGSIYGSDGSLFWGAILFCSFLQSHPNQRLEEVRKEISARQVELFAAALPSLALESI